MSKLTRAMEELARRAAQGDVKAAEGIKLFHGSPYDFPPVRELEMPDGAVVYQHMDDAVPEGASVIKEHPLGRFDMSKIGTGEGAQAYGHGLYFAESEDVAKGYRDDLTASRTGGAQRILQKSGGDVDAAIEAATKEVERLNSLNLTEATGASKRDSLVLLQQEKLSELIKFKRSGKMSKGSMYEVNIDATPDDFLDYDLPLSQQSDKVRSSVSGMLKSKGFDDSQIQAIIDRDIDGQELNAMLGSFDESKGVKHMTGQGIKGIRYKDGFSRGADGGSSNYVVFDDKLIDITKKYGALLFALTTAGLITPEEAQAGFIGATSKMFSREAVDLAESMAASGKSRDEIWKATGEQFGAPMLKGPEGVWKQEISDQGNYIPADQAAGLRQGRTPTVGDALQGQDGPASMVKAYPRLQDSRIKPITSDRIRGSFDPRSGNIQLSTGDSIYARSDEEMASTLQHEGQHYIQERENWAKGGNPEHSARMLDTAKRDLVEAQENAQSVKMQYEDKLTGLGYHNARELSSTASKLSEVDRLKGYLDSYYNGGKLTDKRRHIFNSGQIMEPNAEYRMRMDINWAKPHRPQAERDQNYADYMRQVIAAVEKDMDPKLVEQVRNSGVKNPYAKYQREISNARAKAYEALGAEMETWNGTVRELNQFVNRYEYGGYKTPRKDLYRELAGEVEARTVQERLPMSMDERVASPPWEGKEWTETPPENQVFIDDYGRLATATMGGALAALAGVASADTGGTGGGLVPFDPAIHTPQDLGLGEPGSVSTEYIATVDAPDGSVMLIPTIWWDAEGNPKLFEREDTDKAIELAIDYEQSTGKQFPRFPAGAYAEADDYAISRSKAGGASQTPLARDTTTGMGGMGVQSAPVTQGEEAIIAAQQPAPTGADLMQQANDDFLNSIFNQPGSLLYGADQTNSLLNPDTYNLTYDDIADTSRGAFNAFGGFVGDMEQMLIGGIMQGIGKATTWEDALKMIGGGLGQEIVNAPEGRFGRFEEGIKNYDPAFITSKEVGEQIPEVVPRLGPKNEGRTKAFEMFGGFFSPI